MVEGIIVYRRRAASDNSIKRHGCNHDSSLKPEKKQRCNELDECTRKGDSSQEFHAMDSDSMLGVQKQVNEVEEITSRRETFKSTECDSSGVVKGNLNQKQGIKTDNDQQSFDMKDQRKIVAYLDLEVLQSDLVDVDLAVEASHRGEKVPFVCLTSESYGNPILGYPLEIGEITDGSETTLLLSKESVARKIFGDKRSRVHQLVWRTSKRTPVCYVTNSPSSHVSKNVQATKDSENVEENGVITKEKFLTRRMKNTKQIKRGKTASSQTCVPVEVIFKKISSGITYLA